jgi:PAS domain S-box-containing protein
MEFLADNPENERGIVLTQRAIDTGERQPPYELELKTKDGRQVWVQVNETPIVEGGRTVAIVGALTDITARKQAEQVLQESERRYRAIVEKAGTVVLKFDRDLRVTYWNDFAAEVFGYTREEILGRSLLGSIVPERETSGRDLKALLFAIAEDPDRFASNINQNITKDGRRLWMAWTNRPILDARGNLQEVLSLAMDITALKESEIAHRETVDALRRLRSLSPVPLVAVDREARVLEWNGAAARLTGWTTEEVLGKPCPLLASRGLEEFRAFLAKAEGEGEAVQIIRNCGLKDGGRLDLKAIAVPLRDAQGRAASLQIILFEEPES